MIRLGLAAVSAVIAWAAVTIADRLAARARWDAALDTEHTAAVARGHQLAKEVQR